MSGFRKVELSSFRPGGREEDEEGTADEREGTGSVEGDGGVGPVADASEGGVVADAATAGRLIIRLSAVGSGLEVDAGGLERLAEIRVRQFPRAAVPGG